MSGIDEVVPASAAVKIMSVMVGSTLKATSKALLTSFRSTATPDRLTNPWFASVFKYGHALRSAEISVQYTSKYMGSHTPSRLGVSSISLTISRSWRHELVSWRVSREAIGRGYQSRCQNDCPNHNHYAE